MSEPSALSVRAALPTQRRRRASERPMGALDFSLALVPHVVHREVSARGTVVRDALLRRAAMAFLRASCALELRVVNPVALALAEGRGPFAIPTELRLEALRLYRDETDHALRSAEVLASMGGALDGEAPAFLTRFEVHVPPQAEDDLARLQRFLLVFVVETTSSAQLASLAKDPFLRPDLRELVAHHAMDEARHYALFTALFRELVARSTDDERILYEESIAAHLDDYLAPDVAVARRDLCAVGISGRDADAIIADSYGEAMRERAIHDGGRSTWAAVRRAGRELSDREALERESRPAVPIGRS
ncbi:MAG: diiron oxygenase [Sandaracinaceae bacterium]